MASNSGNQLEMSIEKFEKPSKEMLEILKLRERTNLISGLLVSLSGVSIGCTIYVVQLLNQWGPIL